jgi:N-acetylglutamate synthase-like GNAT family acetyltransferase
VQSTIQLFALPLAPWERDGVKAALIKAGLPADDADAPEVLVWRFERNDVPVGFGGLELHGEVALLRSLVTLPPVRNRGIGTAMVEVIEVEAVARGVRALYLLTTDCVRLFARLGYAPCQRDEIPVAIRNSAQFTALCPATAVAMFKQLQ